MKINQSIWDALNIDIEKYTNADPNITDISINYQIKKPIGTRNFLKLNTTTDK